MSFVRWDEPAPASRAEPAGGMSGAEVGLQQVMLAPGERFFGSHGVEVSCLLGSAVGLIAWCPRLALSAVVVCTHPPRTHGIFIADAMSGLHADDAVNWLTERFRQEGCTLDELDLTLVGGAIGPHAIADLGGACTAWLRRWARVQGLWFERQHVGGVLRRRVRFHADTGDLAVCCVAHATFGV
ncbi:MAG: hypothetical protein QM742_07390 [Aquabacterium sp.]